MELKIRVSLWRAAEYMFLEVFQNAHIYFCTVILLVRITYFVLQRFESSNCKKKNWKKIVNAQVKWCTVYFISKMTLPIYIHAHYLEKCSMKTAKFLCQDLAIIIDICFIRRSDSTGEDQHVSLQPSS